MTAKSTTTKRSSEQLRHSVRDDMLAVCQAYYFDNLTKTEIANSLGMSRFKVARLLERARETGMVTITLRNDDVIIGLSTEVEKKLGVKCAIVVESQGSLESRRQSVGRAAATLLETTLHANEVVGLAWGRTLSAMINAIDAIPPVELVQLTGAVGTDPSESPIELVRRAALVSGRSARGIFAPIFVEDARVANALRQHPEIADVFARFENVTTAVLAVGAARRSESQFFDILPERFVESLQGMGAVGEVCGIPLDKDGHVVDPRFLRHCITIDVRQLRHVERVVAVAAGARKAEALLAATRSRLVNEVVIDADLAQAALRLAGDQASA